MSDTTRTALAHGAAGLAARALNEEFGRPALWPHLGLGLLGFGLSAPFWAGQAAWCLALSAHPAVESGTLYRDSTLDWRLM